jgi:signal transduction histidine kinase
LVTDAIPLDGMVISMLSEDRTLIRAAYLWGGGEELDAAGLPPIPYDPEVPGMQTSVIREGVGKIFDVQKHIATKAGTYSEVTPDGKTREVKPDETKKMDVKSMLMVPMLLDGKVIGVIQAASHDDNAYSQAEMDTLTALTAPLAVAFQNSVLFDAAKREIEERKLAEADLRESEARYRELSLDLEVRVNARTEALQKAIDELNGFTYSVSHDMRTPLRAVISTSRMLILDHGDELSLSARALLDRQVSAAQKMSALVDDLLSYARHGRQKVNRTRVNLTAVFEAVAAQLSLPGSACEGARFAIEPELAGSADPSLVEILATILIENAGKYRSVGAVPTITIGQDSEGNFYVSDDGIGFDMAYVHKLFQPFERLHRDTEYPGTGIGLANARRIIERHGGQMWAVSPGVGRGATFFFTLGEA